MNKPITITIDRNQDGNPEATIKQRGGFEFRMIGEGNRSSMSFPVFDMDGNKNPDLLDDFEEASEGNDELRGAIMTYMMEDEI